MDSGLYAAYRGLMTRMQTLDTAANNLANAGTNGFRAQREYFRSAMVDAGFAATAEGGASQVGNAVNGTGITGGNRLDLSEGVLTPTGNPLDVALRGEGFFAVRIGSNTMYTRDGSFSRSPAGLLQTAQGEQVLDKDGKSITLPSGTVRISEDGTVSVSNSVGSAIVAQIGMFDFPDKSQLRSESNGRILASPDAKPVAAKALLEQGSLEGANQDTVHGSMELVIVQRQAEMMQKALSVFNNDFDKTAVEELPRVS